MSNRSRGNLYRPYTTRYDRGRGGVPTRARGRGTSRLAYTGSAGLAVDTQADTNQLFDNSPNAPQQPGRSPLDTPAPTASASGKATKTSCSTANGGNGDGEGDGVADVDGVGDGDDGGEAELRPVLWVGGLPLEATEEGVRGLFEARGVVPLQVKVIMGGEQTVSDGSACVKVKRKNAFVYVRDKKTMYRAKNMSLAFNDCTLTVRPAKSRNERCYTCREIMPKKELDAHKFVVHSSQASLLASISSQAHPPHASLDSTALSAFSTHLSSLCTKYGPTPASTATYIKLCSQIEAAARTLWSNAVAIPFGSFKTGLYSPGSDLDVAVLTNSDTVHRDGTTNNEVQELQRLCVALQTIGVARSPVVVAEARVPIIRQTKMKGDDIAFDVVLDRNHGIHNSQLLSDYFSIKKTVWTLGFALKLWGKACGIVNSKKGLFSSYSLGLLLLFFLQTRGILPNLQSKALIESAHSKGVTTSGGKALEGGIFEWVKPDFATAECNAKCATNELPRTEDSCQLGRNLLDFLYQYGWCFDFTKNVVSIRLGGCEEKLSKPTSDISITTEKTSAPGTSTTVERVPSQVSAEEPLTSSSTTVTTNTPTTQTTPSHPMTIMDPLDIDINCTGRVSALHLSVIIHAFRQTYSTLVHDLSRNQSSSGGPPPIRPEAAARNFLLPDFSMTSLLNL
ncbi:poly(A) RNA polymerase, mitochondrial [Pelomyxa schiedti]|nr:poly(A) RNA polymerase, mitochondrial [Pelomyxa schiedti]